MRLLKLKSRFITGLALLSVGFAAYFIANNKEDVIHLTYTINAFDVEKGQMDVRITIDNQTTTAFEPSQWSLHWNQIIGKVMPESLPPGVDFTWINGNSYFKLNFGEGWALKAGEQLHFDVVKDGIMSRLALGPFGAFLVQNENLYNVKTTVEWQYAKGLEDLNLPTSKTRYDKLAAVSLISKEKLPLIIPTPKQITVSTNDRPADPHWQIYLSPFFSAHQQDLEQLLAQTAKDIQWVDTIADANLIIDQASSLGDEAYQLRIDKQKIRIGANTYGGMVYAIQSLVQIDVAAQIGSNRLPLVDIEDAPRFAYRGFLLDISRNFYGLDKIKQLVDLMSIYKLNYLDLKLTDDEGWRLEIPGLPELTEVGAKRGYTKDEQDRLIPMYGSGADGGETGNGFLSQQDFIDLLQYARVRNVTVIPQISFPSHARAAVVSMEARRQRFLAAGDEAAAEEFALMDPEDKSVYRSAQLYNDNTINICRESSYAFFEKVVGEVVGMYAAANVKLTQFSIGADELPYGVWQASPLCADKISDKRTLSDLYDANVLRLKGILNKQGVVLSGWEDFLLEHSEQSQSETLIKEERYNYEVIPYVWNNIWGGGREDMNYKFANLGFKTVMSNSSAFYFDMADDRDMESHGLNWSGYVDYFDTWAIDPENIFANATLNEKHQLSEDYIATKVRLDSDKRSNLIGIQSQLFGETVRTEHILNEMLLPNMLVFAERAWDSRPTWTSLPAEQQKAPMLEQWNVFANTLGQQVIPFLNHQFKNLNIHLPKPGGIIANDTLFVRTQFPGIKVRYSTDGSLPTANDKVYNNPIAVANDAKIMLRAFDNNKGGKAIKVVR
ncbi:MAG: family 20 glycosylhydrolase [Flavobacteriaceae bacterium]|nr:family 20 glycosylhydrolase [Flavobacteriaceae bacterium]